MLEDNRLKVFKAVAEEGNFTRAARSLGITQPAVSQCIAELERETGTVLVERSRTVVRLTAEGETFLRYAELVLRDYGALNAVCGAGGRLAPGKRVTVSAPSFVQEYILPDLLSDIRTAATAVFDLRENAGESDIVFSLAPVSGTLDFESAQPLAGDRKLTVGYHAPCRSIALSGESVYAATHAQTLLSRIPNLEVRRLERGCCGFAGYSGFTKRRFTESLRIGSRVFLAARSSALDYRASECSFCNLQLAQGTQKPVAHVLKLLAVSFGLMPLDEIPLETVAVKKKKQKNNAR